MKCPKCGYNSFEFLDQCKKCGNDLVSFKVSKGIRSVLAPVEERVVGPVAAGIVSPGAQAGQSIPLPEDENFSWEEPAVETNPSAPGEEAGMAEFSFGEPASESEPSLDDLLEPSATLERATAPGGEGAKAPAGGLAPGFGGAPGEFEMEDLFAEAPQGKKEEQAESQQAKAPTDGLDGDFDFLFSEEEKK
ncbi:hypothetical protein [Geotalea sp. SG265]|uniref:hypothetical protein n=1 Tax=Geotalea sp. SG265 TaxID=2922867 RepID=UPI001FB013DE|nr:hypothetical protein [Geotalea sp. SG265]